MMVVARILGRVLAPVRYVTNLGRLPLLHRIVILTGLAVAASSLFWYFLDPNFALIFLAVVLGVGLAWWCIRRLAQRRSRQQAEAFDQDLAQGEAVDELQGQWKRAVEELKATAVDRYTMGFYMLIGEPQSGKSTTLRRSGLNFPIGMEAVSGVGGTRNCDWWFTDEAVILDTAGRLTFQEEGSTDRQEFDEFLKLLRQYRKRCPINGVIVTIPCTSLLSDGADQREHKASVIREALVEIQRGLEIQFPVYVLITKADQILGFSDFFARLKGIQQTQLFGWSRPKGRFREPFQAEEIRPAFAQIYERLERWRLFLLSNPDAAGNQEERDRLFAFPEEFAALRAPVEGYLNTIFPESRLVDPLFFRGMYLTSGLQKGVPVAQACSSMLGTKGRDGEGLDLRELFESERAFFIRDFYRKKVFQERGLLSPTTSRIKRVRLFERLGYGIAGAAALIGVAKLSFDLYQIRDEVKEPKAALKAAHTLMRETPGNAGETQTKALDLLADLALIPENRAPDDLAGLLQRIDEGESMSPVGLFSTVSSGERDNLRDQLAALFRWIYVNRVLGPEAESLVQLFVHARESDPAGHEGFASAKEFRSFRDGFATLLQALGSDQKETPTSLQHLLAYYSDHGANPTVRANAEPIDRAYRALVEIESRGWLQLEENEESTLRGTGIYEPLRRFGNQRQFIPQSTSRIGGHWHTLLNPQQGQWLTALDERFFPSRDVESVEERNTAHCYRWFRVYKLYRNLKDLEHDLVGKLDTFGVPSVLSEVHDWSATWAGVFADYEADYEELKGLTQDGAVQPVSWSDALHHVQNLFQQDRERFFSLVNPLDKGTGFNYFPNWKDWSESSVPGEFSRDFETIFNPQGNLGDVILGPGISPPEKEGGLAEGLAEGAKGLVDKTLPEGQGVRVNAAYQTLFAELRSIQDMVHTLRSMQGIETLAALKDTSLKNLTSDEFPNDPGKFLSELEADLVNRSEQSIESRGLEESSSVRRFLARGIKTELIRIFQSTYPDVVALRATAASFLDTAILHPLDSDSEIPIEFMPDIPHRLVWRYLEPMVAWATDRKLEAFDGAGPALSKAWQKAIGEYLAAWNDYWGREYHLVLEKALPKSTDSWDRFYQEYRSLMKFNVNMSGLLARYAVEGCKGLLLKDPDIADGKISMQQVLNQWRVRQSLWRGAQEWLAAPQPSGLEMQENLKTELARFLRAIADLNELHDDRPSAVLNDEDDLVAALTVVEAQRDQLPTESQEDSIPTLENLLKLSESVRRVLSEETSRRLNDDYEKLRTTHLTSVEFPFRAPITNPNPEAKEEPLKGLDLKLRYIDKLVKDYDSFLGLRLPNERDDAEGDRQKPRPDHEYLRRQGVPDNVLIFLEQCADLISFLYGAQLQDLNRSKVSFEVRMHDVINDQAFKKKNLYLVLDLSGAKEEAVPESDDNPKLIDWNYNKDDSVSLSFPSKDQADYGILNNSAKGGPFALLRFLAEEAEPISDFNSPNGVNYIDSPSDANPLTSEVMRQFTVQQNGKDLCSIGLIFIFQERIFPRELPNLDNAIWE
jgi:hypothetical protein